MFVILRFCMKRRSESSDPWDNLTNKIIGLGEKSIRKSYYPELRKKLKDLEQQKLFNQSILNSIPDGIVVTSPQRLILRCNPALYNMFDYADDELVGQPETILFDTEPVYFRREDLLPTVSFRFRRKDGSYFIGEAHGSEIRSDSGELIGYLKVIHDITDRINSVRQRDNLEEQLRQAQKMEAVGTLAGGIAHDFNNLLSAILGYAELARFKQEQEKEVSRDIDQIINAGRKATELVKQILAFSRQEKAKRTFTRPSDLIREVIVLLRASIPSTIVIREQIDSSDTMIMADVSQLHQVLMNLCTNSYHAMETKGGVMTIGLETIEANQLSFNVLPDVDRYAKIFVSDTGEGIEQDVIGRIFDPYFTTKESGKGTGLGLAVVYGIVEEHNGHIEVLSDKESGTSVNIYLPTVVGDQIIADRRKICDITGGSERVLLIEDQQVVRDCIRSFLEQFGYEVRACVDGREAVRVFDTEPQAFDLVITDQTMPGLTGLEVAKALLARRPELPIILCSGYSAALTPEKLRETGIREFMPKPVSLHDLAATMRRVL